MIKANDLRIGDIFISDKIYMYVSGIITEPDGYNRIFYRPINDQRKESVFTIGCEPVLLTAEILEKCGFEIVNHIHGYSFYTLSKSKNKRCHIDIYENKTTWMSSSVNHCQYLHELQNLYRWLTGEELEINL